MGFKLTFVANRRQLLGKKNSPQSSRFCQDEACVWIARFINSIDSQVEDSACWAVEAAENQDTMTQI